MPISTSSKYMCAASGEMGYSLAALSDINLSHFSKKKKNSEREHKFFVKEKKESSKIFYFTLKKIHKNK
jgi:hypothetical protein